MKKLIIAAAASALLTAAVFYAGRKKQVLIPFCRQEEKRRLNCILNVLLLAAVFFSGGYSLLCRSAEPITAVRLFGLFGILSAAALSDLRYRVIPNRLIFLGLSFRLILYGFELFFCREEFLRILQADLLGLAAGAGILLAAALISGGAVGFGDVKLFALIGLTAGLSATVRILFLSLLLTLLGSLVPMIRRKRTGKDPVPFAPGVLAAYLLILVLGLY